MSGELAGELQEVATLVHEPPHRVEERWHVSPRESLGHGTEHGARDLAEKLLRDLRRDAPAAVRRDLLERGERVSHAAARMPRDELERRLVVREALLRAHEGEVRLHLVGTDGVEVEALDAGEDRGEDLLRVGRAHDEDDVGGRLLDGLEQRVERRRREHVDLVDDVDLVVAAHRRVVDAGDDLLADVVDARVGCGVELDDVGVVPRGDETAVLAVATGQAVDAALADERLGEDAGHGRLARAARSAEQIGMARAPLEHGAFEGLDHMLLTDDLLERRRAILCVERFHGASAWGNQYAKHQYTRARRVPHNSKKPTWTSRRGERADGRQVSAPSR